MTWPAPSTPVAGTPFFDLGAARPRHEQAHRPRRLFTRSVPDVDWLRLVVPLGVRMIQLRLKDATDSEVRNQIAASIEITQEYRCQLIVNGLLVSGN